MPQLRATLADPTKSLDPQNNHQNAGRGGKTCPIRPRIPPRPVNIFAGRGKSSPSTSIFTVWEVDPSSTPIRSEIWREGHFRAAVPAPPTLRHLTHLPRPSFAAIDDSLLSPITVEDAHAQSPRADLVAGHVGPVVAQGNAAPARKRQGNMLVQGGNPAAPAAKDRAPGANAAARSRPAAEKVAKAAGGKRKRVLATKKPPPSSAHSAPERGALAMPLNGAAPLASEVFDEMAGRYIRVFGHRNFLCFTPFCDSS